MSKKCVKCNHDIKEGLSVCTNCGAKVERTKREMPEQKKKSGNEGIVWAVVTIIGILVMFNISSPLGGIIYLIAFIGSYNNLKNLHTLSGANGVIDFAKQCLGKDKRMNEGIMVIIVAIIPIVIIVGIYRWIFADTARLVDNMMSNF